MSTGAVVCGRGTIGPAAGWGGDHHDGVPIFVLTRHKPDSGTGQWPLGVPHGVTGIPLSVPVALAASALGAVALLTLAAGAVAARLALRVPPAAAMRAEE